ncbi:hypothetical protein ACFLT6_00745 [Chloroflexota bacterium]
MTEIDWDAVFKLTVGAYGVNIIVLITIAIVAGIVGKIVQKVQAREKTEAKKG